MADVWAKQPIYHPNIDLGIINNSNIRYQNNFNIVSGRVMLPIEWSPVLTLKCLAFAVQMMLLEPSTDNIFNLEACSFYSSSLALFEQQVQSTLKGGRFAGVEFSSVSGTDCQYCKGKFETNDNISRFRHKERYRISSFKENDIEFPNLMTLSCGDCDEMKVDSLTMSPILNSSNKRLSSHQVQQYQSLGRSCNQTEDENYENYDNDDKDNGKCRKRYHDRYDNENSNEMPLTNNNRRNSRKRNDYDDENRDIDYSNVELNCTHDIRYYSAHNNEYCNNMNIEELSPLSKRRVTIALYENI